MSDNLHFKLKKSTKSVSVLDQYFRMNKTEKSVNPVLHFKAADDWSEIFELCML